MDKMTMFNKTMFNNKEESKGPTALSPAPIQDEKGNLTFELVGKTFFLNVNSEEERERVKEEVNANSLTKYDWFKEKTGEKHWVLYNTEMYEIVEDVKRLYLHYKEDSNLTPIIPINATSCYSMFEECSKYTSFDLSNFDTSKVTNMSYMFYNCSNLTSLDFSNCNISKVTSIHWMFCNCSKLTTIYVSNKWNVDNVTESEEMFTDCINLPNYNSYKTKKTNAHYGKGGYLTLKK